MVIRKNIKKKFALISVYDKNNLSYLCRNLKKYNFNIISTGNTCHKIKKLGYKCIDISEITKFKEILKGRVKTLNPKIFGSILYKRNDLDHIKEFKKLNIPKIDLVIVNLYPFKKFIKKNNEDKSLDMIDIGGMSLIRASSKNYKFVTIIPETKYYKKLCDNLKENNGETDIIFRKIMATKSFKISYEYEQVIFKWFNKKKNFNNKIKLRYGENPNQRSIIDSKVSQSILKFQISGKAISYNNIIDVDSGLKCLQEFSEPTCVIIKHKNPCGVASSPSIINSFKKAFISDSKSAFGGVVVLNRKINPELANIISKNFFEVILASDYDKKSLEILKKKKNLILLKVKTIKKETREIRSTIFGTLYQDIDNDTIDKKFLKLVTKNKSTNKKIADLIFSLKVVKHLTSNAIVLSENKQTLGMGFGQSNRYEALKIAINKFKLKYKNKKFVCASDGFFPFTDSIKLLKKNKCTDIAQPSGSINDNKNINYAEKNKISLYFIKNRLFKH